MAISIDPTELESYLAATPESHAKAIFREGILSIASPSSEVITGWLAQQPIQDPRQLQGILTTLTRYGATTAILEAATALIVDLQDSQDKAAEAPYLRSQPEAFLLAILEALPTTSGLFQPNRKLDLKFGSQWMEVDLLAETLSIAIELDGYYHFQNPERYRRDRRKDFELQKQGYLVLRFLTEDLLASLEEILDRIQQAISTQRQRRSLPNKGSLS
jgi:very-short-patch-repair endonuclease